MNAADQQGSSRELEDFEVRCDLSIVIPVYNSEKTLPTLVDRIAEVLTSTGRSFEIVFVDDGSADRSWPVLQELQARHPRMG